MIESFRCFWRCRRNWGHRFLFNGLLEILGRLCYPFLHPLPEADRVSGDLMVASNCYSWYFVSDAHEVMATFVLVGYFWCCWNCQFGHFSKCLNWHFSLQSQSCGLGTIMSDPEQGRFEGCRNWRINWRMQERSTEVTHAIVRSYSRFILILSHFTAMSCSWRATVLSTTWVRQETNFCLDFVFQPNKCYILSIVANSAITYRWTHYPWEEQWCWSLRNCRIFSTFEKPTCEKTPHVLAGGLVSFVIAVLSTHLSDDSASMRFLMNFTCIAVQG
jgi:hypothetical protein